MRVDGWDLIQREPTVVSESRHVLPYADILHCEYARQGFASLKGVYLRLDAVHAAA
jgi:hypothetical protein